MSKSAKMKFVGANGWVRILRETSKWQDRVRAYQVLIDGESVGEIGNGATV